ncbi:MAG TPA: hypothetical protein VNW04_12125 [Puia sp.]|jgi:hypothetical protein|nr:hypothetical protein [Puia sp.]
MKHLLAVLVIAAAMASSCNNSGVEANANPAKSADSAAKAAPDTLKAAAPDSTKK